MRAKTAEDRALLELIDPVAESLGLAVVRVRLMGGTLRRRLQIMAERNLDHDISVEECARLAAWLEIGFGGGEHLAAQAARHPEAVMIGCEPFLNGVASALRHVEEGGLENVRLHADDARAVMAALPDASLDRVMILFPDPWHKARHNKRRFLQDETAVEIARLLKPGGKVRFVTDWLDYADWALERLARTSGLTRRETGADWFAPPEDHVVTRYEEKKLGDTDPIFLEFEKQG